MAHVQRAMLGLLTVSFAATLFGQATGPMPMAWRWVDRVDRIPTGSPLVRDERVYMAVGARMYCLEKSTGNEIWRFPIGEPLNGQFVTGAVLAGDILIAASDDKHVYGINAKTGEHVWDYLTEATVFSNPVVTDRYVVAGLVNNTLVALDTETGQPVWPEPFKNGHTIFKNVKAWGGFVLFLSNDNTLTALDIRTQKPAWRPRQFSNLTSLSELSLYGDILYVTSGSYLTSLSVANGRARWEQSVPGTIQHEAAGGPEGVACVTVDGRLFSFNNFGKPSTRNGFDLRSQPVASPRFVGKMIAVPTSNGSINLINPFSGEVFWNYTVPPLIVGMRVAETKGGATSSTGIGASEKAIADRAKEIKYVLAAGPPVTAGESILMLVKDGSIVMFDQKLGVDLTPPETKMYWPNAGDQVSGRAPMELVVQTTDDGSGVNYDTLKVTINGKLYIHEIDRDNYIHVKINGLTKENAQLDNGRAVVEVSARDWMGNAKTTTFVLTIDNMLPPLGSPPFLDPRTTGQGGKGGKGGGAGGGAGIGGAP